VEALLREDRRAKGIAERRAMGVHIEEAYRLHLQRQRAHGDGFFVAAALYGRASSVRAIVEECGGGRPIDIPAVLARFARRQSVEPASTLGGATDSGEGEGGMPPAARPAASAAPRALGPEEWGSVIDVSGVLQALVEVTVRDAVSESAVVQLFLPAGSKAGALEGFWDPCDGEDKALWLRYEFLGRVHEAGVTDEAPLKCPLRSELRYKIEMRHTMGTAAPDCCVCGAAALLPGAARICILWLVKANRGKRLHRTVERAIGDRSHARVSKRRLRLHNSLFPLAFPPPAEHALKSVPPSFAAQLAVALGSVGPRDSGGSPGVPLRSGSLAAPGTPAASESQLRTRPVAMGADSRLATPVRAAAAGAAAAASENEGAAAALARSPNVTVRKLGLGPASPASKMKAPGGRGQAASASSPEAVTPGKGRPALGVLGGKTGVNALSTDAATEPSSPVCKPAASAAAAALAAMISEVNALQAAAEAGAARRSSAEPSGHGGASAFGRAPRKHGHATSSAHDAMLWPGHHGSHGVGCHEAGDPTAVAVSDGEAGVTDVDLSGASSAEPAIVSYTKAVNPLTGETVVIPLTSPTPLGSATKERRGGSGGGGRSHAVIARAHAKVGLAGHGIRVGRLAGRSGRAGQHTAAAAAAAAGVPVEDEHTGTGGAFGAASSGESGTRGLAPGRGASGSSSSGADAAMAAAAAAAKLRWMHEAGGSAPVAAGSEAAGRSGADAGQQSHRRGSTGGTGLASWQQETTEVALTDGAFSISRAEATGLPSMLRPAVLAGVAAAVVALTALGITLFRRHRAGAGSSSSKRG
jgi:hypothetical protein